MGLLTTVTEAASLTRLSVVLLAAATALSAVYVVSYAVYNIFFHPLKRYPGPKLWAMTLIPYLRVVTSGNGHNRMLELHKKYGPVVRIGPSTLSYSHPEALHDIAGHRKASQLENAKYKPIAEHHGDGIIGATRKNHTRYRKSMANSFSGQALVDQQAIIQSYVDKLIEKLESASQGGKKLDVVSWFNFTTFDIIGDLVFGEPFGCLDDGVYHPWVETIIMAVKNHVYIAAIQQFPKILFFPLLFTFVPRAILSKLQDHYAMTTAKVQKRLAMNADRPDFMAAMTSKKGDDSLAFNELVSNASTLVVGGSETTATALAAAVYFLTTHPSAMRKLNQEVRTAFSNEDEITLMSVGHLEYMLAVIDETLRCQPPVPAPHPREVNALGESIIGEYVGPGTDVMVWVWVAHRDPAHWNLPDEFVPERWLGDPRFSTDKRNAFAPFSVGPRGCIAKNLAYAEMRLILARLVWKYDIELADDSRNWADECKAYIVYEKGPVNVYLTPRKD